MTEVAAFQTKEQIIRTRILKNLEMSDGKPRSYFDVMSRVDQRHRELADEVLKDLIKERVVEARQESRFLPGRPPARLTMYVADMYEVRNLLGE